MFRLIFFIPLVLSHVFANSPKVVVVGGGIAGLTTAYRLQQGGMDVDLYEARDRVGGRIFTAKINGHTAELGGHNISDGGEALNLNRLIDEFELKRVSNHVYRKEMYFDGKDFFPIQEILNSRKIDPSELKKKLHQLALSHRNMKEILEKIIDPDDRLYKILAVRMASYEGGSIENLSSFYVETLFHSLLGGVCSAHQGTRVDLMTIDGGNSLLPQKIGEALGSSLHLHMPLTKVSKTKHETFQLTFKNGTEIEADIVVLAIPCKPFKQIIFEKEVIPRETLENIQKVHYGENAKIFVPFSTSSTSTVLVGNEIVSFFDPVQQIVMIYCIGSTSFFSPQTIANSYNQALPMIERGFDICPSKITPHYAKDEANLFYEGAVGFSWPNDPYSQGSYSYIASGQESSLTETVRENQETFRKLFAPIDQKLYFVGEHTTILFDVSGTMEAACESGERIARAILHNQH